MTKKEINALFKKSGLTKAFIARHMGISRNCVKEWINNPEKMKHYQLDALKSVLEGERIEAKL